MPIFRYFGSAMSNFGVQDFLESFLELAQSPSDRVTMDESVVPAVGPNFSGQIFKLQVRCAI
eukprot:scaffold67119_cov17-Prasinocladus_malaysianus.AAC.1